MYLDCLNQNAKCCWCFYKLNDNKKQVYKLNDNKVLLMFLQVKRQKEMFIRLDQIFVQVQIFQVR